MWKNVSRTLKYSKQALSRTKMDHQQKSWKLQIRLFCIHMTILFLFLLHYRYSTIIILILSFLSLFLPFSKVCPSTTVPAPTNILTCQTTQYCTGIQCCAAIDIKITKLFLNAWLKIDPCNLELSIGLGAWSYTKILTGSDWSVEQTIMVIDPVFSIR